jgi:hypothetical protein
LETLTAEWAQIEQRAAAVPEAAHKPEAVPPDPVADSWGRFITAYPEFRGRDFRAPLTDSPEDQKFLAAIEWWDARESEWTEVRPGEWIATGIK